MQDSARNPTDDDSLLLPRDDRAAGRALRAAAAAATGARRGDLDVVLDGLELEGVAAGDGARLPEHLLRQGALRVLLECVRSCMSAGTSRRMIDRSTRTLQHM